MEKTGAMTSNPCLILPSHNAFDNQKFFSVTLLVVSDIKQIKLFNKF